MNRWQMSEAAGQLSWHKGGGRGTDLRGKTHTSIHPAGRSPEYREKNRRRFRNRTEGSK